MKYDDRGIVVGFEGQMVHSRNKADFSKYVPPHLEPEMLREGTRMIVMGDKINDLDAVGNFRHHASLKVKLLYIPRSSIPSSFCSRTNSG